MERKYLQARMTLEQLEESRCQVARLRRGVDYLQNKCTGATSRYAPRTGQLPEGPAELWNKLSDQKRELELRERRLKRQEKQLIQWIDLLPRPRWRMILRYRYLDGLELNEVAEALTKATGRPFSIHQVYRLHSQALKAAEELWPM